MSGVYIKLNQTPFPLPYGHRISILSDGHAYYEDMVNPCVDLGEAIPAADVVEVKRAYWVKRMEHGVGKGYELYTPIWSCSNCGRDYDPASCSIVKYCYICGAKMEG